MTAVPPSTPLVPPSPNTGLVDASQPKPPPVIPGGGGGGASIPGGGGGGGGGVIDPPLLPADDEDADAAAPGVLGGIPRVMKLMALAQRDKAVKKVIETMIEGFASGQDWKTIAKKLITLLSASVAGSAGVAAVRAKFGPAKPSDATPEEWQPYEQDQLFPWK